MDTPEVKEQVHKFNEIVGLTILNCKTIYTEFQFERGMSFNKTGELDLLSDHCKLAVGLAQKYIAEVQGFYDLLFPYMNEKKQTELKVENSTKKLIAENGYQLGSVKSAIDYREFFRKLLVFAKTRGFLMKESYIEPEGMEFVPDALKGINIFSGKEDDDS